MVDSVTCILGSTQPEVSDGYVRKNPGSRFCRDVEESPCTRSIRLERTAFMRLRETVSETRQKKLDIATHES
jgi:hypothetical protein